MENFLNKIITQKKDEVIFLKNNFTKNDFENYKYFKKSTLSFSNAIKNKNKISIIGEIKKASPSKGIIRKNFDHLQIAKTYFENGVDAISILTDEKYFQGNIQFISEIYNFKSKPLLRKDFVIDEIQIYQAKAFGADAILLISEILDKTQIREYTLCANEIGLDVLLELHSEIQIDKIDFDINKIIGVNNRNLEDFSVDLNTICKISEFLYDGITLVAESGIKTKTDIDKLKQINVNAILVGETFMREDDISQTVQKFIKWCKIEN
ncbi:MAG: indole-3-glycerol phosphate synthase TrpC [Ignavibacterium sp.]